MRLSHFRTGLLSATLLTIVLPASAADEHEDHGDGVLKIVETKSGPVEVRQLASLEFPWGMEYVPNGDLFITEKPGRVQRYSDGKLTELRGVPEVAYRNQGGLLDIAIDPDFDDNQFVYLYYVKAADDQPDNPSVDADPRLGPYVDEEDTTAKRGVVVRGRLDNGDVLNDVEVIWEQSENVIGLGHFGGRLLFTPDEKLIITSGERQKFDPAQDPNSNLGKIIRINKDGSIPEDNPFAEEDAPRNAIWSSGHRNPLGAAIRPETETFYIHEMGPLYGDELNAPVAGGNYGWPTVSNGEHYDRQQIPHHETQPDEFVQPVFYWRPAISPSGLAFYTGDKFEEWEGNAFIGGLSSEALIRVAFDGQNIIEEEHIAMNMRIRDVADGRDGSILLLTDAEDGALLQLLPQSNEDDAEKGD